MIPTLLRGSEPYFLPGGPVGCLCLHGLTASPQEVYWLGAYLADHGLTVHAPRLYGHGLNRHEVLRARWQDWYLSALDGYHLLRRCCNQVFVLGLSMGGLLSLLLASQEPVNGLVVMAAPLRLAASNIQQVHLLRALRLTVMKFKREGDPLDDRIRREQAARGEPVTGRVAYYEHTAVGISELLKLQARVVVALKSIQAPALLIYSKADQAVPIENADRIARGLTASAGVQVLRLQQSGHILTNDVECEQVFEAAWSFVAQTARIPVPGNDEE
jgi:carboxylesterase